MPQLLKSRHRFLVETHCLTSFLICDLLVCDGDDGDDGDDVTVEGEEGLFAEVYLIVGEGTSFRLKFLNMCFFQPLCF